jgi:CRP/FNR family transcriptional regulator, cyclic AMP receptor protein
MADTNESDQAFSGALSSDVRRELYRAGEYIFFEGDIDQHFYIVEDGSVQIFTKSVSGHRLDISKVEPGECFGEMALLDSRARSASAQAHIDCILIKVSAQGYQQLLSELPGWASSMLHSLARRLKHTTEMLQAAPQFLQTEDAKKK